MEDNRLNPGACLRYLSETDEQHARAKARVKYLEQKRKTLKATGFLESTGTVMERESKAYTVSEYKSLLEEYRDAVYDEQIFANKRKSAELEIEVWRTHNANMRKGNLT